MLLPFPGITNEKFWGNLLIIFGQLVMALYSPSASSSTFSAPEYFNGQSAGVGAWLSLFCVFYPESGC